MIIFFKKNIDSIIEVDKINGKFNCPECPSKLSTPTTFNTHLKNKHDGHCETISNNKKRQRLEDDNNNDSISISLKHQSCLALI